MLDIYSSLLIIWHSVLNTQLEPQTVNDLLDKENIAELFDLGTGIFAAILLALSLLAYRNLRVKNLLLLSAAFGLFSVRTIILRLNVFLPETLEVLLALMGFAALALFFFAIIKRIEVRTLTRKQQ